MAAGSLLGFLRDPKGSQGKPRETKGNQWKPRETEQCRNSKTKGTSFFTYRGLGSKGEPRLHARFLQVVKEATKSRASSSDELLRLLKWQEPSKRSQPSKPFDDGQNTRVPGVSMTL